MLVCIPSFEPGPFLPQLVRDLRAQLPDAQVLVVDDGSGAAFDSVFALAVDAGAHLVRSERNRGKGHALRTGFAWATANAPGEAVVCADSDGQHSPRDIARVAGQVTEDTIVLGSRCFAGSVPLRSRLGNTLTRWLFRTLTGVAVRDTQTGLRAFPASLLPWLGGRPGDRFEYEFNVLLRAATARIQLTEIPIETIYLDENTSSHFRPIRDSIRIYAPLLAFLASSLMSAFIDVVALLTLVALTGHLAASVVAARLLSATVNYTLNRDLVFRQRGGRRASATRYVALALAILGANVALITLFTSIWGLPLLAAKLLVEVALFFASYVVQHRLVFRTTGALCHVGRSR